MLFRNLAFIAAVCCVEAASLRKIMPRFTKVTAEEAWAGMNPGWNLGNSLDAIPGETSWGNPLVTETLFDTIKASGIKSVRIPVTWTDHFDSQAPNYNVTAAWMTRVEQVVDWALARNFWVVLNVHHDSWQWATQATGTTAELATKVDKFVKLWAQIASRFKLKSERLIFESLNEPPGSTQEHANRYNDINQRFVNLVRASGGNNADRLLTLPGLNTNIQQTVDWFVEPTNAEPWILHVHDYDPWDFVSTSWGRTFWGSADDKTALEAPFKALQGRWSTRPTMIGEWGLTGTTVEGAASWKYFDFVARTAVAYKSAALLWDNGADHFNRATGLWRDPVKLAIMTAAVKGIKNSLPAEGQTEALYFKVGQTAAATNIALELNGNTITKVAGTKRTLVLGTDYTISTTGILLSASYLTSILTTSTGLRDTVTITFSAGVTLPFRILTYTAATVPVSSYTVSGTGSALSIPFSAPGSTLATVKAVKSDGTPLKDDWTQWLGTLQQARISWGGDFSLDSQGTSVVLSTSLLGEIKTAGLTTLTLEFWPRVGTGNSVLVNVLVN